MFAQESVMGIKKEREAFERLPLAELAIESEFVFYNEETNSYWPNEDFCPSDAAETMNFAWEAWQAAKAHEAEKLKGCVLVPVQCPDPDFADSLFDELSKKAIGEFGDDLLIHFSDIDEEKIWALMVEAAKAQAVPEGFVLVPKENISCYWQDNDEPENFCSNESDFDCLGDCIDLGEIMEINKFTQAHVNKEILFGTWFAEAIDPSEKANFFVGTHAECLEIVAKNKAMIEAQEQSHD